MAWKSPVSQQQKKGQSSEVYSLSDSEGSSSRMATAGTPSVLSLASRRDTPSLCARGHGENAKAQSAVSSDSMKDSASAHLLQDVYAQRESVLKTWLQLHRHWLVVLVLLRKPRYDRFCSLWLKCSEWDLCRTRANHFSKANCM